MGYDFAADDAPEADTAGDDRAALEAALALLAERFEAVTVFVTGFDPATGNTVSNWRGRGNWHARYGQVREWLVKREAEARFEATSALAPEDD